MDSRGFSVWFDTPHVSIFLRQAAGRQEFLKNDPLPRRKGVD
jgi:hypothetical protein